MHSTEELKEVHHAMSNKRFFPRTKSVMMKKLLKALNGHINFETEVGKGATFIIEMPLRD